MTLFPDIAARCIRASSSTAAALVMAGVVVVALNILHGLVVIAARRTAGDICNLILNIDLLALQQSVDDLAQSQIPGAEPVRASPLMLALGLKPEEVPLGAGRKLQHVYATVCRRLLPRRLVRREASIGRDHDQIQFGLGVGCGARAPAEVDQFIFGIEVEIARGLFGLDDLAIVGGLP